MKGLIVIQLVLFLLYQPLYTSYLKILHPVNVDPSILTEEEMVEREPGITLDDIELDRIRKPHLHNLPFEQHNSHGGCTYEKKNS